MPIVSKTLHKAALTATMEVLANAGPTLAHVKPIRHAAVGAAENFMMTRL
jgi:hypothetical protein